MNQRLAMIGNESFESSGRGGLTLPRAPRRKPLPKSIPLPWEDFHAHTRSLLNAASGDAARSAAAALTMSGRSELYPLVYTTLHSDKPDVRLFSARILSLRAPVLLAHKGVTLAESDPDPQLRLVALTSLVTTNHPESERVIEILRHEGSISRSALDDLLERVKECPRAYKCLKPFFGLQVALDTYTIWTSKDGNVGNIRSFSPYLANSLLRLIDEG